MGFKGLITDLDGTLVHLPINWDNLRIKVRKILKTNHPLKPLAPNISKASKGNKNLEKLAFKLVEEEELKAANFACYNDALYNFLKQIKLHGVKTALVTLQGYKSTRKVLENLRIAQFFDIVITRERSLSRLEQLKLALNLLKINPRETLFIGDSPWDSEAGRRVGCFTVIVKNKNVYADEFIDNFLDIKKFFNNIFST